MPDRQPRNLRELMEMQKQQKAQMESKGQDLRLANLLVRALDPSMPKGYRQLGLKQVAQSMGLDPRGSNAKEMINLLSGLDPQSMEGLRDSIAQSAPNREPGQVSQVMRGLLSGSLPPEKVMGMFEKALQPHMVEAAPQPEGFPQPPMKLGGPTEGGGGPWERWTSGESRPRMAAPQPQQAVEAPELIEPPEEAGPLPLKKPPPSQEEAPGELPGVLGIEPGRYRLSDIRDAGWDRIPDDPEARKKMVDEINTKQQGVLNSLTMLNQINGLIQGRPEVLDLVSLRVPYFGEFGINPGTVWENATEFLKGTGVRLPEDKVDMKKLEADPRLDTLTNRVIATVGNKMQDIGMTADEISATRARIKSLMIPLAYTMARASHGPGTLSDTDVLFQFERLGKSQSPEAFSAALSSSANQLFSQYKQDTRVQTGRSVPIAHLATEEVEQAMGQGGLIPPGFHGERATAGAGRFAEPRLLPPSKERIARAEPTLEKEEARIRAEQEEALGFQKEQRAGYREQRQFAREEAARAGRAEERAVRGEERAIAREERAASERRAEQIQAAFVSLGKALASGAPSPVPMPQAPGISPGAFQLGGIQRRSPPGRR
jgi:hypothetical protein